MNFISQKKILFLFLTIFLISEKTISQVNLSQANVQNLQSQLNNTNSTTIQNLQNQLNTNQANSSILINNLLKKQNNLNNTTLKKDKITKENKKNNNIKISNKTNPPLTQSTYESLFKGNIVNPDTMLQHLSIFGYDVLKNYRDGNYSLNEQIAVPADYPVGIGDEIIISLWGRINETQRVKVDRNGTISIPRIGPVPILGLPFDIVQKKIVSKLETIEGVHASIAMGSLRSMQVYVVGEVKKPGLYTLNALSNPTNALFIAGGITKRGSLRNIELRRNGKRIAKLDFYNFLLKGNNFNKITLKPGDVLFVPVVKNMVAITGNVRRSAIYEFNKSITLKKLISLAGGFTPAAWINRIQIERFLKNKSQIILDLKAENYNDIPDFKIKDGDIVKVFNIINRNVNAIFLSGNVQRPGKYEYKKDMKVSDVVGHFSDLLPETYLNYAVIYRRSLPKLDQQILSFNLKNVLEHSSSDDNILLKPSDKIVIYNRDFFEPDRTVFIGGAVTKPGTYKLVENMHIKDLILVAGGLTDASSSKNGELYRRIFFGDTVQTKKISFSVKNVMADNIDNNHILKKSDRVFIRRKRGWEGAKKVSLKGEFVYPGDYVVFEGETLGELIDRAGGFTDKAYLAAAIFTRESVKKLEEKRIKEYIQRLETDLATVGSEIAASGNPDELKELFNQQNTLLKRLQETEPIGRVVINLEKKNEYRNLLLEDMDVLYLPKNLNTVSVIGEVFNPATFVISKDARKNRVNHLIELAGGYKEKSNKKNMYVIKANGSVRTRKMDNISKYELSPGDAVVVPVKIPESSIKFKLFMQTVQSIFSITTNTLLIASTILQIEQSVNNN